MRHAAFALCLVLSAASAASANPQLVESARASYVSLERQGLARFTCSVALNWNAILAVAFRAQPETGKQVESALVGRPLSVTVSVHKPVKVALGEAASAGNGQQAQLIELVATGVNAMLSGVLTVWSSYVLTSPFPASSTPFELTDQAGQWLLSYTDGANKIELTVGKDYMIRIMRSSFSGSSTVVQPAFAQTIRGLLLSAFQAESRSQPAEPPTPLQARFDYQQIEGFDLPKTITLSSSQGGTQLEMVATFGNCSTARR